MGSLYLALPARMRGAQTLRVLANMIVSGAGQALRVIGLATGRGCDSCGDLICNIMPEALDPPSLLENPLTNHQSF
ncbi:MAG TPA: hypothetical protein VGN34_08350 [Ktedonobacteraceae bacterium]